MKIITAPKVYLLSENRLKNGDLQQFLRDEGCENWQPDTMNDSQTLVEVAGRICYMSFNKPRPGGNKAYIDHILEVGHGSVLEHAVFGLAITGVSRALTHELVRHRAGMSPSQLSQRFVDESDCNFVVPPLYIESVKYFQHIQRLEDKERYDGILAPIPDGEPDETLFEIGRRWVESCEIAQESYEIEATLSEKLPELQRIQDKTARRKAAREAARSVLPNCTETKIYITGNARAWRHFIEMRGSEHADAEIQRLAVAVLGVLCNAAPHLFGDYTIQNGAVTTAFRKV